MVQKESRRDRDPRKERRRRRERFVILAVFLLVVILTSLEVFIFRGQAPITSNLLIYGLINVNIILLLLLVFLVFRNVAKLVLERRRGVFGAKLRTKLAVAFVGLSIVPTFLLFWVAAGFIATTVENWFSYQVENSLEESLKVAQVYYENSASNALYYGEQLSRGITQDRLLNDSNLGRLNDFIRAKQEEYNLGVVEVFSSQLEELARAVNPAVPAGSFVSSESKLVQAGLKGKTTTQIRSAGGGDLIRGVVPIYSTWDKRIVVGALVANYYVPQSLVSKMNEISSGFKEYKQLKLLKNPIKLSYLITFSIVTLLIIFSATWFGFYLAKGITGPIQDLGEGTRRVAEGDLDFRIEPAADDEIGGLVDSFNTMTQDLKVSQQKLEQANINLKRTNVELDQRRGYMEIVLRNVTAGVISIDSEGRVTTINKSAEKLLGISPEKVLGEDYRRILSDEAMGEIRHVIQAVEHSGGVALEREIKISFPNKTLTLLVSATALRDESEKWVGLVLVFEDLTQVQKAQRAAAWREVARRIAHEIKNPLTPIQLSAQRLRKRYLDKFSSDGKVFDECTRTIVSQVEELKGLVNEFSNFARMPASNPVPNKLNEIIEDALLLFREGHKDVTFDFQEKNPVPVFNLDRDQMKRVMINLLDNAVDSMEDKGRVAVKTSYDEHLKMVRLEVADNGRGISPEEKSRLFEPYFSTKKSGMGLGLAIVNTIVSDHNGYIRVKDNHPKGTRFVVELPVQL